MRRVLRLWLVCWLCTVHALAGCGGGGQSTPGRFRIVVIPKGTTHAFWQAIRAGALKAAKERGVEVVWDGPAREDQRDEQQKIVERHTAEGVSAIVLAPCDRTALVHPVAAALERGIPVVIIDSGLEPAPQVLDSPKYLGYVATDNHKGGALAAGRMAELFQGKKARVLMLPYQAGSESTEQREKGFAERIAQEKNIEFVVVKEEAGPTVDSAQKAAERMLSNHPGADGVFAPNESSATGVLEALRATGKAGKVRLVGFDGSSVLIDALKAGTADGLVLQDPFEMGYTAVMRAVDALEGRMPPPGELVRHTAVRVATRDNLADPAVRKMYAPE
jgi:ribose transport system substrate-binding protein